MKDIIYKLLILITIVLNFSCSSNEPNQIITIGIENGVKTLNPLFIMNESEANISELLFLALVGHDWDFEKGEPTSYPVLAESVTWEADSNSVLITIKKGSKWQNGKELVAEDIVFSFDLYSDKDVQSRFYGSFNNFYLNDDLSINLEKTFEILNPYKVRINFLHNRNVSCYDFDLPILPKYIFEKIPRNRLSTSTDIKIVGGTGPYKVKEFKNDQFIKLVSSQQSLLYKPNQPDQIIFRIIPDYTTRFFQFKNEEVDIIEGVNQNDVSKLESSDKFIVKSRKGREYDYLGFKWKNQKNDEKNFFDTQNVRKALTMAIDRESILKEYLHNKGEVMTSPISPIFSSVVDKDIVSIKHNTEKAKLLLELDGWKDSNKDGLLDKNGKQFSFQLFFPTGNSFREYTAVRIKNNFRAIGIDVELKALEPAVFFDKMFNNELEAWIAGWSVPIPLSLKSYWHSDPNIAQGNVYQYANVRVDEILNELDYRLPSIKRKELLKEFQNLICNDHPSIFLFWIDQIVVINSRINNVTVSPLATIQKCWEWRIAKD